MLVMRLAKNVANISMTKFVAKWAVRKVPVFGWGMECLDCAFVKRNWTRDQAQLSKSFKVLRDYPVPVWLHIFPEGGRFTDERQRAAAEFARENGMPEFKNVLYPRVRGFHLCAETLRESFDAVYDITLAWDRAPSFGQGFTGDVPYGRRNVYVHVRRFDFEQIPEDEDATREWLIERFYYKERLLETFKKTGKFQPVDDIPVSLTRVTPDSATPQVEVAAKAGGETPPLRSPRAKRAHRKTNK